MMERRVTFFTSDWHIGHANVIKYSQRPFRDVNHMREVLVNNFNATVPVNGVTYFLGDMGMCTSEELKSVVARLNGTKILIVGNHDKGVEAMYKMGFDAVMYGASLLVANKLVTMSHCPLLGVWREDTTNMNVVGPKTCWHGDHKNQRFSTVDRGQFHLHGHIHSKNDAKSKKILDRQWDVGVDANAYRPVSISQVESWVATYGR